MSFTWPADTILPKPTVDLGHRSQPPTIRTNMDSGKARQRRRFPKGNRLIAVSWVFTDEQFEIFQAIVKFKLNDGADYFDMSLPLGGGYATYSVRMVDGDWSARYQDFNHWKVTANLECDELATLTEGELDALLA